MNFLRILQVLVALGSMLPAGAPIAQEPSTVTIQEIEDRRTNVVNTTDLTATEKKRVVDLLQRAAEDVRRAGQYDSEAQTYRSLAQTAESEQRRINEGLARRKPRGANEDLLNASLESIEAELLEAQSKSVTIRRSLTQLRDAMHTERTVSLQPQIDQARQALRSNSGTGQSEQPIVANSREAQLVNRADEQRQLARLNALEQRLITRPARLALLESQVNEASAELADLEAHADLLESSLNQKRQSNANALIETLRQQSASIRAAPPGIQKFAEQNALLVQQLSALQLERQETQRDIAAFDTSLVTLDTKSASLTRLLDLRQFESTASVGSALRRERDASRQLVDLSDKRESAERDLTTIRIALFELDENRPPYERLADLSSLEHPVDTTQWKEAIDSLQTNRQQLLAELNTNYLRQADALSSLLNLLTRLTERSVAYRDLLESHLFWIPSADVVGVNSFVDATKSVEWMLLPDHWRQVSGVVGRISSRNTVVYGVGLLLLLFGVVGRKALKRRLAQMEPLIGKVRTDKFSLTLLALGITLLLAVPVPLTMFLAAGMTASTGGFSSALSTALITAASTLLFMEFFLQLVRPMGVAEIHFRWRPATLVMIKRMNRWLIAVLIPIVIVMVLLEIQATPEIRDGLGRLSLVLLCATIAAVAYQLIKAVPVQTDDGAKTSRLSSIAYPVLIVAMALLIALSLTGYHYTATQLLARIVQSLFIVITGLLAYYILDRASSIYERRIALKRLLAKRAMTAARNADRETAEKSGEVVPELIERQEIDRHAISEQTSSVLRMIVWIGLLAALFTVWRDLLPVGRSLNDLVIWQISSDNPALQPQSITLWSLMVALSVVLISYFAVKNLPGILEVAILSRLNLATGTGYAITTVVKYAIFIVGIFAVSNLLGADWSKLQWLVAALGVGLGFGLQEIVANFVSGIIILFERPFRLGDTVTIGGQSGTVTKIQTRATTIKDWDGKELIIPNKSFVTNEFVNWTLTDATTRLVIAVGIAYGSDVQLAIDTLQTVARNNTRVLDEPPPAALFLGFSDSALSLELRVFTRSIGDRLALTHELHLAIDRSFRDAAIEISFPQIDLHVRSTTPFEFNLKHDDRVAK